MNRQARANGDLQLGHLDGNDRELVLELLKRHGEETGSIRRHAARETAAQPDPLRQGAPRTISAVLALRDEGRGRGRGPGQRRHLAQDPGGDPTSRLIPVVS
ncbi:hypothetical protein QJS66_02220 [Kocuria rhizophila]|nr:hypothetical protein QJS66_02220 [Kocuria rhizophila]